MLPFLTDSVGNADSRSHRYGRAAHEAIERARGQLAGLLGARPDEIVFTSGATESNAIALEGTLRNEELARVVVTQATEHRSVLEPLRRLELAGRPLEILRVDRHGVLDVEALETAVVKRAALVSVMLTNNEIGTAQPIEAIAALTLAHGAALHIDAAQGLGYRPLDVRSLPVDLISLSAHKMYGPQGVGALFVRRFGRADPAPLFLGGGQERGRRSGTSNVAGIVGFGEAAAIMVREGAAEAERLRGLRDTLAARLLELDGVHRNGDVRENHPGNLSVRFDGVSAARLLVELEPVVALSTGSACSSGGKPSHVLEAIGLQADERASTIRFGLGRSTGEADVDLIGAAFESAIASLRGPLDAAPSRT